MKQVLHLSIKGRVQGVGYRAFVEDEAAARGLEGWVRNRRDGSVEAVVSGEGEQIEGLIAACRKGPRSARVDSVDIGAAAPEVLNLRPPGQKFALLPTE